MKARMNQSWITVLAVVDGALAVAVTLAGILTAFGHNHRAFTSLWGEVVQVQNGGLYTHESVSMAAQGVGMDLVTLVVATPLLLVSAVLAARGSVRAQLLRVGAFFYFTYAYLVILFGIVYNPMFLAYVVLLTCSATGLILSLFSVDVQRLPGLMSPAFRRRATGWTLLGLNVMFMLLWLGRVVPTIGSGEPPQGLETYTTLSVQAADLSIVIPLSMVAAVLLLRNEPLGYLLAAPMIVFIATIGLALTGMVIAMAAMGTTVGVGDVLPAVITSVIGITMAAHFTWSVREPGVTAAERPAVVTPGRAA